MGIRVADRLSWCVCGGRTVFLDLAADRYFCLPAAAEDCFLQLCRGNDEIPGLAALQPLFERGMLIDDPACHAPPRPCALEPVERDLLERPYPPPKLSLLVRLFASEIRTARLLRARPLIDLVQRLEDSKPKQEPDGGRRNDAKEIVAASMALSLVLRATDRCLVRAIAVHRMCRRYGVGSSLVFGVRMNPFSAHAWVQLGNAVLVGDFEQVRIYKPILALG